MLRPHLLLAAFSLLLLCAGAQAQDQPAPIRFLLTFDDGPAAAVNDNPTVHILDVLARKNIK
ncbi:polysaccharide deacetylase, partial [Pseudoxanthomonas sp. KAs_5_3]